MRAVKSIGSIFPGTDGKAQHDFSSADALANFNTIVISLETADDGDQNMSPVRILSALVDLR